MASPYSAQVYDVLPYFAGPSDLDYEDPAVTLRKILADILKDGKEDDKFLLTDFDIEETWMPYEELTKLNRDHANGKLYLVALPSDKQNISRTNHANQTIPILVGFQIGKLKSNDLDQIDKLTSFIGQIEFACRSPDLEGFAYTRTEAIKDDNGVPFALPQLVSKGLFETYFVIHYNFPVI